MSTRVDLHLHSRFSTQPDEWFLQAVRAPESWSEPRDLYRRCRERGMCFITISDHDTIDGALTIAHLPDTFLSSEVTVRFPEDGCLIHCLVLGVSEEQHREIQRLRGDLYAFRDYTEQEGILCSVAHPFFRVNGRLTVDHVERLILLFDRFEARNGIHDGGGNELVEELLGGLTREAVERMAERQDLAPRGERPWIKHLTGGSDDHGGHYAGTTWTQTPPAATVEDFLGHLRAGRSAPGGEGGSSHRLAQSVYTIADGYCRERFPRSSDPFRATLARLGVAPGSPRKRWWVLPGRDRTPAAPPRKEETLSRATSAVTSGMRRFLVRSGLSLAGGNVSGGLGALAELAPVAAALLPYLFALDAQHRDAELLVRTRRRFGLREPGGKAWLSDLWEESAARAATGVAREAARRELDLTVVTCGGRIRERGVPIVRLKPLARLPRLALDLPRLAVPPVLDLVTRLEADRVDEVVAATPGPMGLAAVLAAKLLGTRLTVLHSTDLAGRVGRRTGHPDAEDLVWRYLGWLYERADRILVRHRGQRRQLSERGILAERIEVLRRGGDNLLRPASSDEETRWGDLVTVLFSAGAGSVTAPRPVLSRLVAASGSR